MSHLKFLFLFTLPPSRKTCFYFSLKTGCITSTFIAICILTVAFIMDLITSTNNIYFTLIKHFVFSIVNFVSFVYMVKSKYAFDYTKAYIGYLCFLVAFGFHIVIFMINILFGITFSPISLFYVKSIKVITLYKNLFLFVMPNLLYIFFEFYTSWICYSYTKNLSDGNDALVDGQNFDRYFEDLGSDNVSRESRELKNKNIELNDSNNEVII